MAEPVALDRTLVMGVVNVTPDSFSDGGRWLNADAAIAQGLELAGQGADLIDVGGESTRPGAARVDPAAEQRRVLPVIAALAEAGVTVSVDTMNATTAAAAASVGARIVNDVSGGLADPEMAAAVADLDIDFVAMHWRGHSQRMNSLAVYADVVADVRAELSDRLHALTGAGIPESRIVLDPGLGFAKEAQHNWALLAGLDELASLGRPLLVGVSRKRFLGELLPSGAPVVERDLPTAVISALAARAGVWAVRVHDVIGTRLALDVVQAWQGGERA